MRAPSIRVLMIEDDPSDAQILRAALAQGSGLAATVVHAPLLATALRQLASRTFDVILCDLRLPDSTGADTVAKVRARAGRTPVIILTVSDDDAMALRAIQLGAQDYLVKSHVQVYPALLRRAVRYALERKQAELERERLQEQLGQAHRLEAVGRFAGGIAHDFNNFLQIILGFASLIRARDPEDAPLQSDMREIVHAAESAGGMVQQLLAFSRRRPSQPRVFELNRHLAKLTRLIQQLIGSSVALRLALSRQALMIRCDPTGLEQVVMNLCANARDAMPDGGALTLSTRRVALDAPFARAHSWARPGDYVRLSVRDTGAGMDPETAARIFEPFFTTKQLGRGTGLGLAVVYGLVTQHEGLIDIETAVGRGTTFHLYFPRLGAGAAGLDKPPEPEGTTSEQTRRNRQKVLVVDDDAAVGLLCARMLGEEYDTAMATSAQRALELLGDQSYDVLVTDVRMPAMDGFALSEQAVRLRPSLKVLLMTGSLTGELEERARAYPIIRKPFTGSGLRAALEGCR